MLTSATPHVARNNRVVIESLTGIPSGFKDMGPAKGDTDVTLYIVLTEGNLNGLMTTLDGVSTPGSASYGKYVNTMQLFQFLVPTPQAVADVTAWVDSIQEKVVARKYLNSWFQIKIPVSKANQLLAAEFHVYEDTNTKETVIRTLSYSIPDNLVNHVDFVYPTIHFDHSFPNDPLPDPDPSAGRDDLKADRCDPKAVTPYCLQQLYGIPRTLITTGTQRLGVIGHNEEYANKEDLKSFLERFRPDLDLDKPNVKTLIDFNFKSVDGGQNIQELNEAGIEADLDMQYTIGVAPGIPVAFISVGSDTTTGIPSYLRWIYALLVEVDNHLPKVISLSYGTDERYLTPRVARKICNGFAALAMRGVSVISASGDGGVGGAIDQDRQNCVDFVPTTAACPYITSVGATTLVDGSSGNTLPAESGASLSSGGFSNYFTTPAYQNTAIQDYLSSAGLPNEYDGKFNRQGRGFPDVSAAGENIAYVWRGQVDTGDGTSASAPIFASVIALINNARAQGGKSPLGFLNPFLYQNPHLFNDITSGNNPGCNTEGFSAVAGWDPVTGLGTPKFEALKDAALKL
ncbi:hypothetical protein NM688_g556 [Phlebia brevispora]|uniref:Uncharacterized protein n=1 Tax=Phlebia brevispora TaxID=194682 RepID=A0ACC1TE73_9APHY|nr:hypothetical protein NM688_g556 [Phlebia brevispora]